MDLNTDFSQRVVIHSAEAPWVASPMKGVDRRMLDRIGGEVARATSIVRYAAGSAFSAHTHTGGEEFIVLEGVFQDEHGDFPAGTYVRNPPTTSHTPRSDKGCVIFVKLWQFDMDDRTQFRKDMAGEAVVLREGVKETVLFKDDRETVRYVALEADAVYEADTIGGSEVLILSGEAQDSTDALTEGTWVRTPDGQQQTITAGPQGATLWIKSGHLPFAAAPIV